MASPRTSGESYFNLSRRGKQFRFDGGVSWWTLRPRFIDHLFPGSFGLKNQLDQFARCAFTASANRRVMGCFLHFFDGIADRDRQTYAAHYCQIRQVVAEVSNFVFLHPSFLQDFFVGGNLVGLLLVNEFDAEFIHASTERGAFSAGDHPHTKSSGAAETQPLTVVRIKRFYFQSGTVRLRQ